MNQTVVVTGGSGHAGWPVVRHLLEQGYDVRVADRVPPLGKGAPYKLVDLEDYGQTVGVLAGAGAVVHLAAIPRPTYFTADVVFRANMMSMFNVLEACATLGIGRVVYGSSVSVLGFPFYTQPLWPVYAPVDEAHPRLPQDAYGISKHLGEELAEAYVRRVGMSIISLRMPWIQTPESFKVDIAPLQGDAAAGASNLWSYIDARDVAQACQLALESPLTGHEAFFIAAEDTFMREPTADLLRAHFPQTQVRPDLTGNQAMLSSAKAGRMLGFKARYGWETYR